jgi:hypothetical protein
MNRFPSSFAGSPKVDASYRLSEDHRGLMVTFVVNNRAFFTREASEGEFFEGLWKFDCGELWLHDPKSGRYIELNLAPNGAWWSCVFESARRRDRESHSPRCITSSVIEDEFWQASLSISYAEIERCLGTTENLRVNVTLVVGGCPDLDVPLENLHSIAPIAEVDFHRPQDWLPMLEVVNTR